MLASSLDYLETLDHVAHLVVPRIADWCVVDVLEGATIHRLAIAHADPAKEEAAREFLRRNPPDPNATTGVAQVLRTGEAEVYTEIPERTLREVVRDEADLRVLREVGLRSAMVVPMIAHGHTLGAITFVAVESGRRFKPEDLGFARELAERAAIAVDNARLYHTAKETRGEAERRMREEQALREATAAVTASFTAEAVIQQIAQSALAATNADCAVVERIDIAQNEVKVVAVAGRPMIPLGTGVEYRGSLTEQVVERQESVIIPVLSEARGRFYSELFRACPECSALAVPLVDTGEAIGALILVREPEKWTFRPDEAERARTFANLAALAFHKVHLLEESEHRREEMQRVMASLAHLMRGFSHDVKNPLGAADSYL